MKYVEYKKLYPDELEDRLYASVEADEVRRADNLHEGEERE